MQLGERMAGTGADVSLAAGREGSRLVVAWLYVLTAMVFLMVVVGGATRLTDSGLSITEWKPIVGIIPPLTDAAWHDAVSHGGYSARALARLLGCSHQNVIKGVARHQARLDEMGDKR